MFQFDKRYPSLIKSPGKVTVILYGSIGSDEFATFHKALVGHMDLNIDYVIRHNYSPLNVNAEDANKIGLSGYGVELDIKNLEYKNKDDAKINKNNDVHESHQHAKDDSLNGFMFHKLKQLNSDIKDSLDEFRKHLFESTLELAPLKAWQMQDLSLQAAQRIVEADSTDALTVLEDLSQNFPMRARALSKVQVKAELKKAFKSQRVRMENALQLESGAGAMFLNGLQVNMDTIDIFSLTAMLRKESQLIESLHQIGLSLDQIKQLVHLDTTSKTKGYGVDIRDSSIQWLNNLEADQKYSHWSKTMQEILRPTYPGMTRSIARNFFNLVFMLDPAKSESQVLLRTAESFFVNDIPVRIGFVFVTNNENEVDGFKEANVALFRAHNYIKMTMKSNYKAFSFITDVSI